MTNNERIIRMPEVEKRVGLKKTAIYQRVKDNTFPQPIKMGSHATGWLESEINKWIIDQANSRNPANDHDEKVAA